MLDVEFTDIAEIPNFRSQILLPNKILRPMAIVEISVRELAEKLASPERDRLQLIDVREPQEVAIAHLEGFEIFPLSEFAERSPALLDRLDPEAETLVLCHHGMRSAQMCYWLIQQGFGNVKNIAGGIDAYSQTIDPGVPRY